MNKNGLKFICTKMADFLILFCFIMNSAEEFLITLLYQIVHFLLGFMDEPTGH